MGSSAFGDEATDRDEREEVHGEARGSRAGALARGRTRARLPSPAAAGVPAVARRPAACITTLLALAAAGVTVYMHRSGAPRRCLPSCVTMTDLVVSSAERARSSGSVPVPSDKSIAPPRAPDRRALPRHEPHPRGYAGGEDNASTRARLRVDGRRVSRRSRKDRDPLTGVGLFGLRAPPARPRLRQLRHDDAALVRRCSPAQPFASRPSSATRRSRAVR